MFNKAMCESFPTSWTELSGYLIQTVLYGVKTWGPNLNKDNNWKDFDCQIRQGKDMHQPHNTSWWKDGLL